MGGGYFFCVVHEAKCVLPVPFNNVVVDFKVGNLKLASLSLYFAALSVKV